MKKQMRRDILKSRMALDDQIIAEKSKVICDKIRQLPEYKNGHTVMAYLPFRKEVDLSSLFNDLWADGKRVVIPVCDTKEIALIPSELIDLEEDLQCGTWGILEPKAEKLRPVNPLEIDCVLVPGVSFDPSCNRLGYGGGYYDRFLPRLKENTPKIAVAFQLQIQASLFPDIYDIPMDFVVTEENLYCRR